MVVTAISLIEVIELIIVLAIMNVVLLIPVGLALFRAYLEWRENETIRQSRR